MALPCASSGQPVGSYYSHSGAAPPVGLVAGVVVGLIAAPLLALLYAYGDVYIPIVYLNIILTAGFGALLALVPSIVMRGAKVRNTSAVMGIAFLCTLAGYCASWILWIFVLLQKGDAHVGIMELLLHPRDVYERILKINETGTWSMSHGEPVSGIFLWVVWLIEAAAIFGVAFLTARSHATALPFCEKCGQWCDKARVAAATTPADPKEVKQKVEAGDWAFASSLARVPSDNGLFFQWEYQQCPSCKQFSTLSVVSVTITRDKRGRTNKKRAVFVPRLIIEPQVIDQLRNPQPVAPPAASGPVIRMSAAPAAAVSTPTAPPLATADAPLPPAPAPAKDKPLLDL